MRRRIALLGATGSIGASTLSVIAAHRDRFTLVAASAHTRETELLKIGEEHTGATLALSGAETARPEIAYRGTGGLLDLVRETDADVIVNGIAGSEGLLPSVAALESGKDLALANKETLVMAGKLIRDLALQNGCRLIPVDSEHAALFALKEKIENSDIEHLVLTASGGAFRTLSLEALPTVSWKDALAHPTWDMGAKITIDSASMANKGLEIIEACELFDVGEESVKVVIHPQSCVHGMVSTKDGSYYAQLSLPDMRVPIQNALSYPDVIDYPFPKLLFDDLHLEFAEPDLNRYPCLSLARSAARGGGAFPLVFNAANEVAVDAFVHEQIRFTDIPTLIAECLDGDWGESLLTFDRILELDSSAREKAQSLLHSMANYT
jgi:1-deoxy-D-xylulose-5-phosphate reductoisomerase